MNIFQQCPCSQSSLSSIFKLSQFLSLWSLSNILSSHLTSHTINKHKKLEFSSFENIIQSLLPMVSNGEKYSFPITHWLLILKATKVSCKFLSCEFFSRYNGNGAYILLLSEDHDQCPVCRGWRKVILCRSDTSDWWTQLGSLCTMLPPPPSPLHHLVGLQPQHCQHSVTQSTIHRVITNLVQRKIFLFIYYVWFNSTLANFYLHLETERQHVCILSLDLIWYW